MREKNKNCESEFITDEKLSDIKNIDININDSKTDRLNKYIKEINNPYIFKFEDIKIKLEFSSDDEPSIEEIFSKIIVLS